MINNCELSPAGVYVRELLEGGIPVSEISVDEWYAAVADLPLLNKLIEECKEKEGGFERSDVYRSEKVRSAPVSGEVLGQIFFGNDGM